MPLGTKVQVSIRADTTQVNELLLETAITTDMILANIEGLGLAGIHSKWSESY